MTETLGDLIAIGTYPNEFAAGVVRAKLEESGIPAQAINSNQSLIGAFGQSGWLPFTVWVRRDDEARAREILEAVRAEQGTVDWEAVDVGDPEPGDALATRIAAGERGGPSLHARMITAGGLLIASIVLGIVGGDLGGIVSNWGIAVTVVSTVLFIAACGLAASVMFQRRARKS